MKYQIRPILWDRARVRVMREGQLQEPVQMRCMIQRDHITKLNVSDNSLSIVMGGRGYFDADAGVWPGSEVEHNGKVYTVAEQKLHSMGGVPHHEEVLFG